MHQRNICSGSANKIRSAAARAARHTSDRVRPALISARAANFTSEVCDRADQPSTSTASSFSFSNRSGVHDASGRLLLKSLTPVELDEWCRGNGESQQRSTQLLRWLYGSQRWIRDLEDAGPAFSKVFKAKVSHCASLSGGLQLQDVHTARDGTRKLIFALTPHDGSASGTVETVLIPMTNRAGDSLRYTACLSTQVGCAMACQFCYTGRMGLLGNLTTAQIVEQVVEARRYLAEQEVDTPIQNIVFMGMGEPLNNYSAVMASIDILTAGLQFARDKVIVSTVGLVPEMRAFLAARKAKLAVSLHATTDEVRDWLVPTNRRYPLVELLSVLEERFLLTQKRGDDFVLIEYILLRDVNDTLADAQRLLKLINNIYCCINLIVFNPHAGAPQFEQSRDEDVRAFRSVLTGAGRICTVRASKGDDQMAACGQLGDLRLATRPPPMLQPPVRFAATHSDACHASRGVAVA